MTGLAVAALFAAGASAQDCAPCRQVYRTIYDEQRVTAYRLTYETAFEEREVTTMKPEWVAETRQRTYRVCKPVAETSTRNEVHRVTKPVMETETRYQQHVVRKAVCETVMQNQNVTTCEPVTTMRTQYVDQGGYVDQCVTTPGTVRNRLQWLPGAYFTDPRTGTQVYHRGGLHWVPTETPGATTVQRQYVPNIVAQQIPQTTYVQKVVTQQTPVQVTKYVDEVVQQPVQVQVQKWVTEEVTRPVTVTSYKYQYEDRVEDYQVQTMHWVSQVNKVQVPHTVAKWTPYVTTRLVPRTVCEQAPLSGCDPCAQSTTMGYPPSTTVVPSESSVPAVPMTPADKKPQLTTPESSIMNRPLTNGSTGSSEPTKAAEPTKATPPKESSESKSGSEASDDDETGAPALEKIDSELNSATGEKKTT
jgi:hypothetical protein